MPNSSISSSEEPSLYRHSAIHEGRRSRSLLLALLFLAMVFGGDRLLYQGAAAAMKYSSYPLARSYSGGSQADVLVLGNSRALRHLDLAALTAAGRSPISLAVDGNSAEIVEALFNDYLERNPKPKDIILELTCLTSSNKGIRSLKAFSGESEALSRLLAAEEPSLAAAGRIFNLFVFNSPEFMRIAKGILRSPEQEFLRGQGANFDKTLTLPRQLLITEANAAALQRMVNEAVKRNIRLHLVVTPLFPTAANSGLKQDLLASAQGFSGMPGVALWNYADAVPLKDAYSDPTHLNVDGVRILTAAAQRPGELLDRLRIH